MLLDANRVLAALGRDVEKLQSQLKDSDVEASTGYAIANALLLLRNRERGGSAAIVAQFNDLGVLLAKLKPDLAGADGSLLSAWSAAADSVARGKNTQNLREIERHWRDSLAQFQHLSRAIALARFAPGVKEQIGKSIVTWETADLLRQSAKAGDDCASQQMSVDITKETLTQYLRDRFSEPTLEVTACSPLAGGFGKQTVLFAVAGKALQGEFVMRRDFGARPTVANDCHLVRQEYPVIKAAHARGFPAPDAIWLDTVHRLLPGGDFLIMRRAPGTLAGSFFGARGNIATGVADSLAEIAARLHGLQPLRELGSLTDSIAPELWDLPVQDCVERYIRNWYELWQREQHMPSPALMSIYGWLFDHVPKRTGRPVLLHGDLGFNNFLLDNGQLSAVLDWEFAHIGDPAEELGYIKVTTGASLDWQRFMDRYRAAGGTAIDAQTIQYFQVWGYARNATAANLLTAMFEYGHTDDMKVPILPASHSPNFLRGAQALIDSA